MINKQAYVQCPYCNTYIKVATEDEEYHVVLCYPEEGGCDKYFVVKMEINIEYAVYTMKFERMEFNRMVEQNE